jgi:hypothetical protein
MPSSLGWQITDLPTPELLGLSEFRMRSSPGSRSPLYFGLSTLLLLLVGVERLV